MSTDADTRTDTDTAPKPSPTPRPPERQDARVRGLAPALRALARPRVLLVLLLVVALAGAGGYFGWHTMQAEADAKARRSAVEAARTYATDLSTYDHTKLASNFAKVSANATGSFAEQYKQVSSNLTELIKQHKAVSKGSVISAGVVEAGQARAVVLLFVDQTITNTNSPQPRIDRNRMRMELQRQDDRWLVHDVKLL